MFTDYMLRGLSVGGWVIGFIAALGSFAAIVALLCLMLSYLFGGGKHD